NIVYKGDVSDVYPIMAAYNTGFDVNQQLTGLKNGIYELRTNAWYRPGQTGEGDTEEGKDLVPVQVYLNNFNTPIRCVYTDVVEYADAVNGVNCRYDATGDPSAPHNGEFTNRVDRNTGIGYIPDDAVTGAYAFHGDRYAMKAYAIVEDGTLKLGIHHIGTPWLNKNLSVWGGFKLFYQGQDINVLADIFNHYQDRINLLEDQRYGIQNYFFSRSHTDRVNNLIIQGASAGAAEGMEIVKQLNEEIDKIPASHNIYVELFTVGEYFLKLSDQASEAGDEEMSAALAQKGYEIQDIVYDGSLTDEEAQRLLNELMEDPEFGGVYVQGDVYDEASEGGEWPYSKFCTLYPLKKNSEGKYVGTVVLQNRSGRKNAYGRAGFFISRLSKEYRCAET
ncbi:MAG: hypothetical protein HUK03_08215, partial [Bacteroidaceae bacterium]|nr:hypothetical protein [Bacteroidaceae bacterium]